MILKTDKITSTQIVETEWTRTWSLVRFLIWVEVDVLICGRISGGAQIALAEAEIKLWWRIRRCHKL